MNKSMNHLPGVKSIEYLLMNAPVELNLKGKPGDYPISIYGGFQKIELIGMGKLVVDSDDKGNQGLVDSKLSFFTQNLPLIIGSKYYFKITLVCGSKYLIGLPKYPSPTIKYKNTISDAVSERRGYKVDISWISPFEPLVLKEQQVL